jgi:hypothetical protein
VKIPAQEKIAELERRVIALEEQARKLQKSHIASKLSSESLFGDSWKQMWRSFHEVMNKL